MKNQESVPKIKKNLTKTLIFCVFASIFVLCLVLGNFSQAFLPANQVALNLSTQAERLYFLSVAKSQVQNSAKSLAGDYQVLGAGGYVWKHEGYFHVIASCYEKENDAALVQNSIKVNYNLDSEIFCVDLPSVALTGEYENEEKKVLSKSLKIFYSTYLSLFDIAVSLDTCVYNEISARLAVNNCYSAFNSTLTDFKTLFGQSQDAVLAKMESLLSDGVQAMEDLCSGKLQSNGQTYSSLIKYRYTQIIEIFYNFLLSF